MNIKRNCYDKKLSPLALFFLTAFNWLWFRTYLWGCRNKFCFRYCFTAHLPRVKAMGAQYWRERGVGWNYSFRPNYRSTPFHIMSTQWGAGSISRGRERWSFHNILFRSVLFPNDFTARQSLFFMGQGWNLALYYISLLSDQGGGWVNHVCSSLLSDNPEPDLYFIFPLYTIVAKQWWLW